MPDDHVALEVGLVWSLVVTHGTRQTRRLATLQLEVLQQTAAPLVALSAALAHPATWNSSCQVYPQQHRIGNVGRDKKES